MGADSTSSVSVVIVARNEQGRIRDCVASVLDTDRRIAPEEEILVDSNSSDATTEIAREYPITVSSIPSDDLTSQGAGRQVGFHQARNEFPFGRVEVVDEPKSNPA